MQSVVPDATDTRHGCWISGSVHDYRKRLAARIACNTVGADSRFGSRLWNVTAGAIWVSSDPTVVQVVSPGFVRGLKAGVAQLSASYAGFADSLLVRVEQFPPYPFLSFTMGDPRIAGRTATARVSLVTGPSRSEDVTQAATWHSSNPRVATVDHGVVTSLSPGNADITASYDGLSRTYHVSVLPMG